MRFDFCIGNPPYQQELEGTSDRPLYPYLLDAAYEIADIVETITPGRFLFNAGKTSKDWNEKMLNDEHLKIMYYEQNSSKLFSNTDIKGGVAICLRNRNKIYEPIKVFTPFNELISILDKVKQISNIFLDSIYYSTDSYKFSSIMHKEHPEIKDSLSKGHEKTVASSVFTTIPNIFTKEKQNQDDLQFIGVIKNIRYWRYIKKEYIEEHPNLNKYKVILPGNNGSGALGEVLSTPLIGEPLIGEPLIGHTQTFISFGAFDTKDEAENCMKYIKTKFARVCLGILKITQSNKKETWKYVPIQDFIKNSDIDWSKNISEIDEQLFLKYNLDDNEKQFIKEKIKEMG